MYLISIICFINIKWNKSTNKTSNDPYKSDININQKNSNNNKLQSTSVTKDLLREFEIYATLFHSIENQKLIKL